MPLPPDVHRDVEGLLRARLVELARAGADVVVDFSFWSRAMRAEYRELLRPLGVVTWMAEVRRRPASGSIPSRSMSASQFPRAGALRQDRPGVVERPAGG
jgi:predicted kinase